MEVLYPVLGFFGGLARALYGLMKAIDDGEPIRKGYFISTLVTSAIIGALLGQFFDVDYRIAAIAGYAGTDLLEKVARSALPKTIILEK